MGMIVGLAAPLFMSAPRPAGAQCATICPSPGVCVVGYHFQAFGAWYLIGGFGGNAVFHNPASSFFPCTTTFIVPLYFQTTSNVVFGTVLQGSPGPAQCVGFLYRVGYGYPNVCVINNADGLPVELQNFEVL
jgi:hypothetical protein